MPSLDGVNATPQFTDLQFGYDDLIPIYDLSERVPKATTFRDLLEALGYKGTSVIDALRVYKANNAASGEPPIDDQYFTQTDGTDTTSTLTYNADCWAARFDLTGTAWHAASGNGGGARRAHLIGPKAVVFAEHYDPTGPMTFTNAQGQRFTYSLATGSVTTSTENLLTFSESFMNTPFVRWSVASGATSSLSTTVSDPLGYGGIDVWKLNGGSDAGAVLSRDLTGLYIGAIYTISCYFKKGTSDLIRLALYDSNTAPNSKHIDIAWDSEGVPSTSDSSGASNIAYTSVGSGWYRCSFSANALNTDGTQSVFIYPDRNGTSKNVYAFGAQVNTGDTLKTYQKTDASAITSGVTYQATQSLGNDAKIGVLSASVDTSLRLYEVETSVQAGEFLLATRSRQSSTTASPYRQRVHFTQAETSYDGDSSVVALRKTSESSSSAFQAYMDDPDVGDSSDGTFTVDDNNVPKLVSTNYSFNSGFTNGPFYGKGTRLRDMDDFLSAWSTTREGRAPY